VLWRFAGRRFSLGIGFLLTSGTVTDIEDDIHCLDEGRLCVAATGILSILEIALLIFVENTVWKTRFFHVFAPC
jgi:hypothetical protein